MKLKADAQLLFTAGMTLVDSLDSVLMLYSYAGFLGDGWKVIERVEKAGDEEGVGLRDETVEEPDAQALKMKRHLMSNLSVVLTTMSIVVAFRCASYPLSLQRHLKSGYSVSLITIMGLIGDNCTACRNAADAEDGGGLAGSWWRGWAKVRD